MSKRYSQVQLVEFPVSWITYFRQKDFLVPAVCILVAIAAAFVFGIFNIWGALDNFDFLGTGIGLIPVIPILVILHKIKREEWMHKLPKYLSVDYMLENRCCIRINYTKLMAEHEIRAQATSVSRILTDKSHFPLKQYIMEDFEKVVQKDNNKILNQGKPFVLYRVKLHIDVTKEALVNGENKYRLKDKVFSKLRAMAETDLLSVYPSFEGEDELCYEPLNNELISP